MRNFFLTFIFALIMTNILGQTEKSTYKKIADEFQVNYNDGKYDSIFTMFSPEMQNALPLDKTISFLANSKNQLGQILRKDFLKYDKTFAVYKGYFENTLFNINISIDKSSKINGFSFTPYQPDNIPVIERNKTKLSLPFKGSWSVVWGGDTRELNYHVENRAQKNAFDFLIIDKTGKSYKADGKSNEDYYAFAKEILAPCDGKIILSVDGIKDNNPNEMNSFHVGGNTVILKTANNEYLVFCHFKNHSIKVKEGQETKQGELLGLCGNSGHSSEPHLHFHIQNVEDMNIATGVKCYFDKLIVNGQLKNDYSPIKSDIIKSDQE